MSVLNFSDALYLGTQSADAAYLGAEKVWPLFTLDLDFTREAVDPRVTFSRPSEKTYYGADGLLKTALANEWPREYDPLTGECFGRSVWGARTNLCTVSEDITAAQWGKANVILTADATTDPTGATGMDLYECGGGGSRLTHAHTSLAFGVYAGSVFLKKASSRYVTFALSKSTALSEATGFVLDFDTGTIFAESTNGTDILPVAGTARAQELPGGIFRVSLSANIVGGTSICFLFIAPHGSAPAGITTGTLGESVYVWGGQFESARNVGPYIPVPSTTAITRADEEAHIFGLGSFSHSAAEGSWVVEYRAVNVNSSSTFYALSYGDGTSGGFANLATMDYRGIVGSIAGNLPGGINNYAHDAPVKIALTVQQSGANIASRAWSNFPFGPASGQATGKTLSGFTYLGIGGRSRGGGNNDAELGGVIRRIRYAPLLLSDPVMAALAA